MPTERELARENGWFDEVLSKGPYGPVGIQRGKVCQACGEIGVVDAIEEDTAAHSEIGDFLAFSRGHHWCNKCAGTVIRRKWRYCEVCRAEVPADHQGRVGVHWLCHGCRGLIARAELHPKVVLAYLAVRRFDTHGLVAIIDKGKEELSAPPCESWQRRTLFVPPGWLPRGLTVCGDCGQVTGWTKRVVLGGRVVDCGSRCLCHGIECRDCGRKLIHRPISDYFNPISGWWHVGWNAAMDRRCWDCRALKQISAGGAVPYRPE